MAGIALLPWQKAVWQCLEVYRRHDRLPQALLLSGPSGLGKRQLVQRFAKILLCANRSACGHCFACRLLEAGTHPDCVTVAPEADKDLTVDKIRDLIDTLALKPQYGQGRVVVIHSSDRMNTAAANSLLKTLEEPAPGTMIVLLSEFPGRVPVTIRSRCQHLKLAVPPLEVSRLWLKGQGFAEEMAELALALNGGAPLAARDWLLSDAPAKRGKFLKVLSQLFEGRKDPVILAQGWQDEPLEQIIAWLLALTADLVRLSMGLEEPLLNPDQRTWLQVKAKELNLARLFKFWQRLLEMREAVHTQLNKALLLEALFLATARLKA